MTASQLLLAGFVAYWLTSQYRNEKSVLHDVLLNQYGETYEQVVDSMLFSQVVSPVIAVTRLDTLRWEAGSDSLFRQHTAGVKSATDIYKRTVDPVKSMVTITLSDDSTQKVPEESSVIRIKSQDQNNLLLRSVRMIIHQTSDSLPGYHMGGGLIQGLPNDTLFKKIYLDKVNLGGYNLKYTWVSDSVPRGSGAGHPAIWIEAPLADNLPGIKVTRFAPYLLKQILPQILFALVLLILTGSAFLLTWRSLKRQMALNVLRNDFVGNISHELKTPVSTVKVAIEAIRNFDRASNREKTSEYLDMAAQEMNRLDRLVTRVLDQSLLEEKRGVIHKEVFDLNELINSVIQSFRPKIEETGSTVHLTTLTTHNSERSGDPDESRDPQLTTIDPDPDSQATTSPIILSGDKTYLHSVFANLLDNSLKYGGTGVRVVFKTWREDQKAYVTISDNGPGIPREYRSRVFEKFFRVPGNNRHNIKGYGLGLSFAAQVMKQHGGSIILDKTQNGGCSFTLTFPVKSP